MLKYITSSSVWAGVAIVSLIAGLAFYFGRTSGPDRAAPATEIPVDFQRGLETEGVAFRYSPPVPLQRLATEWEPQRALVLSMSFPEAMAAPDIALFQVQLLAIAHHYNEIFIFCEHDHNQAHSYFLSLIDQHPEAAAILAKTHFVDSRNLMRWARDFGPIFGYDASGGLVAIDFVYRNLNRDMEEVATQNSESFRKFMTLQGDAMPVDVAVHLQQYYDLPVQIVRPPLWMDGGDIVHDGRGNVFVSTQTLIRNGGNRHSLEELFRLYFGATKLHVMEPLPGATVNHLDMILKFVDANTVMLPEFIPAPAESLNRYRLNLSNQVKSVLAQNEAYLKKHLPHLKIIKVPMPPILFMSNTEILAEAESMFLRIVALQKGVMPGREIDQLTEVARKDLERRMRASIVEEIGYVDFTTIEGFNRVLKHYGQMPMDKYFDLHSESVTRYRSYINSVFLHSSNGKHGFILPRFTSQDPIESRQLSEWEQQAEAAYRVAWPQAQMHWINCDSMVTDSGFIHCVTVTVPAALK